MTPTATIEHIKNPEHLLIALKDRSARGAKTQDLLNFLDTVLPSIGGTAILENPENQELQKFRQQLRVDLKKSELDDLTKKLSDRRDLPIHPDKVNEQIENVRNFLASKVNLVEMPELATVPIIANTDKHVKECLARVNLDVCINNIVYLLQENLVEKSEESERITRTAKILHWAIQIDPSIDTTPLVKKLRSEIMDACNVNDREFKTRLEPLEALRISRTLLTYLKKENDLADLEPLARKATLDLAEKILTDGQYPHELRVEKLGTGDFSMVTFEHRFKFKDVFNQYLDAAEADDNLERIKELRDKAVILDKIQTFHKEITQGSLRRARAIIRDLKGDAPEGEMTKLSKIIAHESRYLGIPRFCNFLVYRRNRAP